jgi:hypothetical protein
VICRVPKGRRRTVRVICIVRLVNARVVSARLTRGGRLYARGRRAASGALKLQTVRRMPAGTYTLTAVMANRHGGTSVVRRKVKIAR